MASDRKKRKINISKLKTVKKTKRDEKSDKKRSPETDELNTNENTEESGSHFEIIKGKIKRRKIIRFVTYGIIAAVIIAVIIVNALTPTGLIEYIQNGYAAMGDGTLPVNVYSDNALNMYSRNGVISIVNDTFFELYNEKGKLIQAGSHGMSNPNLEYSEERFLLFDRDRYKVSVFNYSDELYSVSFDNQIVSAAIGRDGTFAVVIDSDSYQNTVLVYEKDYKSGDEPIYKWNSANYYVTDVAVCDDGEKIAVSLLDSNGGVFSSYVYVLEFDSEKPLQKFTYDDIVSSLTDVGESYILVNGFDRAYSVPWDRSSDTDIEISGNIRCYDFSCEGISAVAYGREDNEYSNTVAVLGTGGKVKSRFQFDGAVTDIAVNEARVAVLSERKVYLYDLKGNLKAEKETETNGLFVGLDENNSIFVLDNSKLIKVN